MKCYNCKTIIPDEMLFCPHCGQPQQISDGLISAAIAGDQVALADLYHRTDDAVYNTIRFIVKDEDAVLDILQDSYIKAFQSLDQLQEARKFEPWVKRIAHNKAIDYLRKAKPIAFSAMLPDDSDEVLEIADDRPENLPDVVIDQQETTRLINEILDALPEDQRACIALYYYDQLSVKEIAAELKIPEATVKSRLQYGRRKIETQVKELEKRGTKLYSLAPIPFFMALLRAAGTLEAPVDLLPGILAGGSGSAGAIGSIAVKTAGAAAKGAAKAAVGATVKTAIATKIAAAAVIVTLIGGGMTAAVIHHNRQVEREQATANAASAEAEQEEESQQEKSESLPAQHPQEESESEKQEVPKESEASRPATDEPAPCMHQLLERYAAFLEMDPQEYVALGREGEEDNISYELLNEYFRSGQTVYAGWADINHDASKELVIALGDETNKQAWAVYATDGQVPFSLSPVGPLGYRVNLYVLADGTFLIHESGGAANGQDTICEISQDRNQVFVLERYAYDEAKYGSMDHFGEGGSLTEQEFNDRYWNRAVEAAQLPEIEFFVLKEGQEPAVIEEPQEHTQPEDTSTWQEAYQQILNGYQDCMSGGLEGNSPYLQYVWVRMALEVQDGSRAVQYALYDVNHDGQMELVMAMDQAMGGGGASDWWNVFEIYTFDGTKAVPLFLDQVTIDLDHSLAIWAAGGLSVSSLQEGQTFYSIPAGTAELKLLDEYLIQFDEKVDQELEYHSILTPIVSVVEEMQSNGFSEEMISYIKAQLMIPEDLKTEDRIDFNNPTYWDVGERWLINCEFYHDGELIACALVDRDTGELVRNIMIYSGE